MPTTHIIDYSDLWHIDCLNTKVINGIFGDDIALGKWDGARQIRVVDNLLTHSVHILLTRSDVVAKLECLDLDATILLPETFEVFCQPDALPKLRRLRLGTLHSSIERPVARLLSCQQNLTHLSVKGPLDEEAEALVARKSLLPFALLASDDTAGELS